MTAEPFDLVTALRDTAGARADCLLSTHARLRKAEAQIARVQHLIDTTDAWAIPLDYVREALHGKQDRPS